MKIELLDFVTYCVGNLADKWQRSAAFVFDTLRSSGVLNDYIVPCYDVLHTFSKDYLVDDLTAAVREKGVEI